MMLCNLFFLIITHAVVSSAEVTKGDLKKFAVANNIVAGRLDPRLIHGTKGNVVFCPASLMTGLGIFMYGARGNTQEELYKVLGYEAARLPNSKVPATFDYMFSEMLPQNDPSTVNFTLSCADLVLVSNRSPLNDVYEKEVEKLYSATVRNIDFANNPEDVARKINYFVAELTNGKINKIVKDVGPGTSSLAINAVYFRGQWDIPFSTESTKSQMFHSPAGKKSVPFMRVSGPFPYTETDDYQAVFLSYVGKNVGLLVLLPREHDGLSTLEETMTPDMIVNVVNRLQIRSVDVSIPKTKLEYTRDFTNDFRTLGATSAYDGWGDFSGMTKEKHLVVSGPVHKTKFVIDEGDQDGCNQRIYIPPAHTYEFTADHPYMFAVVDRRDDLLLLVGRVVKP